MKAFDDWLDKNYTNEDLEKGLGPQPIDAFRAGALATVDFLSSISAFDLDWFTRDKIDQEVEEYLK